MAEGFIPNIATRSFLSKLMQWEPAIGVPGYVSSNYPRKNFDLDSVSHVDFMFIAYHREALEVLMPWVEEFQGREGT